MAFVPDYKYDCFLSYSSRDKAWVADFQTELKKRLADLLFGECSIWWDGDGESLIAGDNIPETLGVAIRASSTFISVVSRNRSDWCDKEVQTFLGHLDRPGQPEAGGHGRFFKVVKVPWPNNAHLGFHYPYKNVDFFDGKYRLGYPPDSPQFGQTLESFVLHMETVLTAMLAGTMKVFVGGETGRASDRSKVVSQIRAAGYSLSPHPDGRVYGLSSELIYESIQQSCATVHLLGKPLQDEDRRNVDFALAAKKKVIFCVLGDVREGAAARAVEELQKNPWKLKGGEWDLLSGRFCDTLLDGLIGALPRPLAAARQQTPKVYVNCDPNTESDWVFAQELRDRISSAEAKSGFRVDLPPQPGTTLGPQQTAKQLLGECDGLLLYRDQAPRSWFLQALSELDVEAGRPKSRALLTPGPFQWDDLKVIQRSDPFELKQLEDFLSPLRGAYA